MASIGMMEGAYFVGRLELLNWLNEFFGFTYKKVEECCSGAAYCQIMDAIHQNVPIHKVNFNARLEYEYVQNYKVLQSAFDHVSLTRYIDVQKLIKGKYQDNLEFLQWFKRYFDLEYNPNSNYQAVERRAIAMQQFNSKGKSTGSKVASSRSARSPSVLPSTSTSSKKTPKTGNVSSGKEQTQQRVSPSASAVSHNVNKNKENSYNNVGCATPEASEVVAPKTTPIISSNSSKEQDLMKEIQELQDVAVAMEKERNFYYSKLSEIDKLIQEAADSIPETLLSKIQNVLYDE